MKWIGIGAIVLGTLACDNKSKDVNVWVNVPPPLFQELDGDALPDIIFGVEVSLWKSYDEHDRYARDIVYDIYYKKIRVMASLPNQNSFCGPIQTINPKCRYYITEKKTAVKTYGTNLTEKNRVMSSN